MRHGHKVAAATLVTSLFTAAGICPPSPGPPPADACDNPDADVMLTSLEVGGSVEDVFVPWSTDGGHVVLTRGGQGSDMLGVRFRLRSPRALSCMGQQTVLDMGGSELARRSESLRLYPTSTPGEFSTRTLWVVLDTFLEDGAAVTLRVRTGGQELARALVMRSVEVMPVSMGAAPVRLCRGVEVPASVGIHAPAPPGQAVGVVGEPAGLVDGATSVAIPQGSTRGAWNVTGRLTGTGRVKVFDWTGVSITDVEVVDGTPTLVAPAGPLTVVPGGSATVRLALSCASAADAVLNMQSTPAGALVHDASVIIRAGHLGVDVRVGVGTGATGNLQLAASDGSGQQVTVALNTGTPAPPAPGELVVDEVYEGAEYGGTDANCDGNISLSDTFFEVQNTTTRALDMGGVALGLEPYVEGEPVETPWLAPAGALGPGERVVILRGSVGDVDAGPWCAPLRAARDRGAVFSQVVPNLPYPRAVLVRGRDGNTLHRLGRPEGVYSFKDAWLRGSSTGLHSGGTGHAPDRAFTPGTAADVMVP